MKSFDGQMDSVDTSESRFGTPTLAGDRLAIPVVDVGIAEHPLNPDASLVYLDRAYLVFDHVSASSRRVRDYEPSGKLAAGSYDVADLDAKTPSAENTFRLQGVEGLDPGRYVLDWQIRAQSFTLFVPDDVRTADAPFGLDARLSTFMVTPAGAL